MVREVAGSNSAGSILNVSLACRSSQLGESITIKSSMLFIRSNRSIEKDMLEMAVVYLNVYLL